MTSAARLLRCATLMVLLLAEQSTAGMCGTNSPADVLAELATITPQSEAKARNRRLKCLWSHVLYLDMGYEHFASPTAVVRIHKRTEPRKSRVYEILPRFLEFPDTRQDAAMVLGFYSWPKSYDHLVQVEDLATEKAIVFAVLGNKKAVPWLIQQYRRIDRKFRSRPIFSYPQKMTYLNALYHLATPEALPFLDEVIENPKPEKIKPRAERVRERIVELFQQ